MGAYELDCAKRRALLAVSEAESAGFAVGENLSVTSRQRAGNPAAQAQRLALARQHAARLTTATAPLDEAVFPEAPTVQAVDYKTGPALDQPLDPPPTTPYPVNEVLAEATDLDGNRVLLRRGYLRCEK